MRFTLILFLIPLIHVSSSAPSPKDTMSPFELAMLDKLHQPWNKPVKPVKPLYPRKGETICKEGVCKVKMDECEDCQYAMPLEFERKSKTRVRTVRYYNRL